MRNVGWVLVLGAMACGGDDKDGGDGSSTQGFGPTQDCIDYLACTAVTDAENQSLYEATYGQGGECWVTAEDALACTQVCEASMQAQQLLQPTVTECWVDGVAPSADLLFPEPVVYDQVADPDCGLDLGDTVVVQAVSSTDVTFSWDSYYGDLYTVATMTGLTFEGHDAFLLGDETVTGEFGDGLNTGSLRLVSKQNGEKVIDCTWDLTKR